MKIYKPCGNDKLLILNKKTSKKVFINDVMLLRGETNYTHFILRSGTEILVARPISFFEAFLNTHGFIRVHRRYMVNTNHVINIDNSATSLTLRSGHTAQISRRKKRNLYDERKSLKTAHITDGRWKNIIKEFIQPSFKT